MTRLAFQVAPERQSTRLRQHAPPSTSHDDNSDDDDGFDNYSPSSDEDGTTFKTAARLPRSFTRQHELRALLEMIKSGWLDLEPEYQREVVWKPTTMTGLINSILEDYYIPPVIFKIEKVAVTDNGTKPVEKWKRVCIDGKQRLSSVKAFVAGDIPCHDSQKRRWFWVDNRDAGKKVMKRKILPDSVKDEFMKKTFVCTEYQNLAPEQEEDIFARVQKGVELKPAEKVRATSGPWQDLAKVFERSFPRVFGLIQGGRSAGFRVALSSFSQIQEMRSLKDDNDDCPFRMDIGSLKRFCDKPQGCNDRTKSHLRRVFHLFDDIVGARPETFANHNYTHAKTFAPIELVAVAVLISRYMDDIRPEGLANGILDMRASIRRTTVDVRADPRAWKVIWPCLRELGKRKDALIRPASVMESFASPGAVIGSRTVPASPNEVKKDSRIRTRSLSADSVLGDAGSSPQSVTQPSPARETGLRDQPDRSAESSRLSSPYLLNGSKRPLDKGATKSAAEYGREWMAKRRKSVQIKSEKDA